MLESSTVEGRQVRNKLHGLLECAAVQHAESSASRRRELPIAPSWQEKEALVHPEP
jgi:hypothetical protein